MILFSKDFWSVALERMVKTIAQVAIATITASTFIPTVGEAWINVLVTSGLAGLISVLTSLTSYDAVTKAVTSPVQADVDLAIEAMKRKAQGPAI